ncbi:hypothetical protein Scep_022034 [Stephania cephalantha]|uniref:DNA helicase n=1 Tax=Stephania cephalantha TaxID=152367 RepID=A0AAP0F4K6_9MAGN
MGGESEMEIEVRSLAGESTTVSISPNTTTTQDLINLLLNLQSSFLPTQNFHLFFKGAKMVAERLISSYHIQPTDFIVLVPFTKKKSNPNNHIQVQQQSDVPLRTSSLADSTWSDLMQDLSSLSDPSTSQCQSHSDLTSERFVVGSKRRKLLRNRFPDDVLNTVLCLNEVFDGKFIEASLKQFDCLSDSVTGECLLLKVVRSGRGRSCVCPRWLKAMLKSFSFLNVFSGFLQMQHVELTLDRLKTAMKQQGLDVGVPDVEHLSILCPQVVRLSGQEIEAVRASDAIVITDPSTESRDQYEAASNHTIGRKRASVSAIINIIRKRERTFESSLLDAFRSSVCSDQSSFAKKKIYETKETDSAVDKLSVLSDTNLLRPIEMLEHLREGFGTHGQIVHVEEIKARMANYVEIPSELSDFTKSILKKIGISRLYCHQAESIHASLSGKNVIVATMVSSGKSLCYNIPVVEVLSQNLLSCALYLFPTKALAQDQLRNLSLMTEGLKLSLNAGVYDGDTSQEARQWLRDNARLLITNPDMLHLSILPFHSQFQRILANLRFIIIDEAHAYKGAFGCHTALVLRRLRRLFYGCDPLFIFCTGTSGNPREHAMELASLTTLELIQNDGSPSGPKFFVLWNPPFLNTGSKKIDKMDTCESAHKEVTSRRSSPIMEVSSLLAEMVLHGLHCIAFCKTRKLSELVLCYTREILQEVAPQLVDSVFAYRAGYIAQDRRKIENEFFGGKLRGIAATNALELGIDVGDVDATLHLGFPGSFASLWQQVGRSGRRERPSLAVYVAFEGPLDQYYMKYPEKLFKSQVECCHIDAQNKQVLEQHLVCAALEYPLNLLYDEKYFGPGLNSAISTLMNKGHLFSDSGDSSSRIWSYIGHEKNPSRAVSLRAIESEKYKVIDHKRNEVLEEIEESRAFFQIYEGAVYMHQGKTYIVKSLDLAAKIALCQEADLKYYTRTRDYTDVYVVNGNLAYPTKVSGMQQSRANAQANNCQVTTTWFGFYRIWRGSREIFDAVELSLPKYTYKSHAVWIRVPQPIKAAVENQKLSFRAGLHAASHAVLQVVPLFIQCNSSDLASECANPHDKRYFPERILLKETGCPNCIQILSCGEYNEVLEKRTAIVILKGVIEAESHV